MRYDRCMDERTVGFLIAAVGLGIVAIGLLFAVGALGWFGRLPGDISYSGDNVRVFVPITTMLLLSVGLSLALWIASRFF